MRNAPAFHEGLDTGPYKVQIMIETAASAAISGMLTRTSSNAN